MVYQAMVSRLARRKLPPMEVLLVTESRLKVGMVRTMDSHRAVDSHRAMDNHPARENHRITESHRVMSIPPATELLLAAKMVLARGTLPAADVVRATTILRAVEEMAVLQVTARTMGVRLALATVRLATVRPAMGALQATELTIITPRPHLSHHHQAIRDPSRQHPVQDRLILASCQLVPRTQTAPILHPRWVILSRGQGLHFQPQPLGRAMTREPRTRTTRIPHLAPAARLAQVVTTHQALPRHRVA